MNHSDRTAALGLASLLGGICLLVACGKSAGDVSGGSVEERTVEQLEREFELKAWECTSSEQGFLSVDCSMVQSCAVGAAGGYVCWGLPYPIEPELHEGFRVARVVVSEQGNCVIEQDGRARCWGLGHSGVINVPSRRWRDLDLGWTHGCGITLDGGADCWGCQETGSGDVEGRRHCLPPWGVEFTSICAGKRRSCGVSVAGEVMCWGREETDSVTAAGGQFVDVECGRMGGCGLTTGGRIECWGTPDMSTSEASPGADVELVQMDSSTLATCGLTSGGEVWCWEATWSWRRIEGLELIDLCVSSLHACGVTTDGYIHCWGPTGTSRMCPP